MGTCGTGGCGDTVKAERRDLDKERHRGEAVLWKSKEPSWVGAENIFRGEMGARAKNIKLDPSVEGPKYHRGTGAAALHTPCLPSVPRPRP